MTIERCQSLEVPQYPIRQLTRCDKAASSPLLGTLLDHLKQILAIVIIPHQVSAVDNKDKRR